MLETFSKNLYYKFCIFYSKILKVILITYDINVFIIYAQISFYYFSKNVWILVIHGPYI